MTHAPRILSIPMPMIQTSRYRHVLALAALTVVSTLPATAQSRPHYEDEAARSAVAALVEAHGGAAAWDAVETLDFMFFTKLVGQPNSGFLSHESTEVATGRATLDWPVLGATMGWDGEEVWSKDWPLPLPPGFFARLTYSFITMPFQVLREPFHVESPATGRLPNDPTEYQTIRLTREGQSPVIPGTFYRLYIHPETGLMKAIEFDISHPAMAQVPGQVLGPNAHVFTEYATVDGLTIPTYYETYRLFAGETVPTAIHAVFALDTNRGFDPKEAERPEGAEVDEATMEFWGVS